MGTTAHSDDLRSRVVEEILAGASRREAAQRFKVSAASAVRWAQLYSQTGGVGPRPRGGKSRSPLEPQAAWLLDLNTKKPPSRGNAALGRPQALRVLSSEAVPNPFPISPELPAKDAPKRVSSAPHCHSMNRRP